MSIPISVGAAHVVSMVPTACLKTNGLFTDALGPIFDLLTGAFGNLLLPLSVLVFIVLLILAIVTVRSDASGPLKAAVLALLIPILGVLALVIQHAAFVGINNASNC